MRRQDIVVQDFADGGCVYRFKQRANGGQQWRKLYKDNETALVVVYNSYRRKDIVTAFEIQEETQELKKKEEV